MKFRKKPVVIEAVQFWGVTPEGEFLWNDAPEWLIGALQQPPGTPNKLSVQTEPRIHARVYTLEGTMEADVNDWIIRGVKCELYPCKPDIFEATYEQVE